MALARFALRNAIQLRHQSSVAPLMVGGGRCLNRMLHGHSDHHQLFAKSFSTESSSSSSPDSGGGDGGKEVVVQTDGGKKKWRSIFPRRHNRKRSLSNWRGDNNRDIFSGLVPSSVGHALLEAAGNINKLFESFAPPELVGRFREKDDHYKLKFEVPGLNKDELKVSVQDGVLTIRGEHKEEAEESDDEYWSGYYDAVLALPDDAKPDKIKAELKDGVLTIVVPKDEKRAKDVKVVQIQ